MSITELFADRKKLFAWNRQQSIIPCQAELISIHAFSFIAIAHRHHLLLMNRQY